MSNDNSRWIRYGDKKIPMPPEMNLEKAKEIMARHFPELAEPKVETQTEDGAQVYVFTKQMGRKGASAHTPGPWTLSNRYDDSPRVLDSRGYEIAALDGSPILEGYSEKLGVRHWSGHLGTAYIERPEGELQANARLIAAAPDLLAVCEQAFAWINNFGEHAPIIMGGEAELAETLRAALALTRGETA